MEKGDDAGRLLYPTLMFRVGNVDPARAGVVIMKSARARRPEEPQADRNVRLVRKAEASDNGTCGAIAGFGDNGEARVSADSRRCRCA